MLDLTFIEKRVLINFLGGRLGAISEFLCCNSEQIDAEEFFDSFYFYLRDLCDRLEADFNIRYE